MAAPARPQRASELFQLRDFWVGGAVLTSLRCAALAEVDEAARTTAREAGRNMVGGARGKERRSEGERKTDGRWTGVQLTSTVVALDFSREPRPFCQRAKAAIFRSAVPAADNSHSRPTTTVIICCILDSSRVSSIEATAMPSDHTFSSTDATPPEYPSSSVSNHVNVESIYSLSVFFCTTVE